MKKQRDILAESFSDYVIDAMRRTNLRQSEVARLSGVSRQLISQIAGKKPNSTTGKLMLPERETVDAIAKAFGDPISKARKAAGYDVELAPESTSVQGEDAELASQLEQVIGIINKIPKAKRERLVKILDSIYVTTDEEAASEPRSAAPQKSPVKIIGHTVVPLDPLPARKVTEKAGKKK